MARHKKKNKLKRHLTVWKRGIKRLNRKKILLWFKTNINLKQHPFVFGLVFLIWINYIFKRGAFAKNNIMNLTKLHIAICISWFVLVICSNLLRDRQKVKWYIRKRFVFFMLLLFPPLGLILLWSGAQFKKITKILFTLLFAAAFIIFNIYSNKKYEQFIAKSPFDRIVEMITKPKQNVFLKAIKADELKSLNISTIPKKSRLKLAVSEIASRCSPAIVSIKTKDRLGKELGLGSGFIISEDGFIVTNFHVVESAYEAEVKIGDDVFKEVYIVKGVPNLDIAVLKVNASNLPVLSIGDSDSLVNGQYVIVLGNPVGFDRSISSGIISAMRSKGEIKVIQMTAPVSPGSSGGPVINEYGEVVGITTLASFFMAQNLNFAIPINYLKKMVDVDNFGGKLWKKKKKS